MTPTDGPPVRCTSCGDVLHPDQEDGSCNVCYFLRERTPTNEGRIHAMPKGQVATKPLVDDDNTLDLEKIQEKTRRTGQYLKWKAGDNHVRILMIPGEHSWFLDAFTHFVRQGDSGTSFVCLKSLDKRQRCYGCEEQNRLRASGSQADQDDAKGMRAKRQYYSPMVDLKEKEKGVQIARYGVMIMDLLMPYAADAAYGNPFHDAKGRDWTIIQTHKGGDKQNVGYSAKVSADACPIEDATWLEQVRELVPQLQDQIKPLSYEEQKAVFVEPDDDEGDTAPARLKGDVRVATTPGRNVPVKPEDIRFPDAEDEDAEEEEEEQVAPPPARETRAPRVVAPVTVAERICPDCDVVVTGKFCTDCGQLLEEKTPAPTEGTLDVIKDRLRSRRQAAV